jgi:hypothetical protein
VLYGKTTEERNTAFATKLVNLAALMTEHPTVRWTTWSLGKVYVSSAEEMLETSRTIGGTWEKYSDDYDYMLRQPGDDTHFDLEISASHNLICEKVGEEIVEREEIISDEVRRAVEAGETKIVTTTTKAVWKCPDSLLAVVAENEGE